MCNEAVFVSIFTVCLLCVITGPVLLIVGGVIYSYADCEVLEIANVSSIGPATQGIGLCDAIFAYSYGRGVLTMECPVNATIQGGNVAVCYPVMHPERYQVALIASSLEVTPHSLPLSLLIAGAIVTAVPVVLMLVGLGGNLIEHCMKKEKGSDVFSDVGH